MRGVLFLVVGPSGVGKDTLIEASRARLAGNPDFVFVRRVVTRPGGSIGEDHEPMTEADFSTADAAGTFFVSWRAHGLAYGIRRTALEALEDGRNVVLNVSRGVVAAIVARVPATVVLSVTAPPDVVRARLEARGREDAADVAARLARQVPVAGDGVVTEVANDGSIETGVERFLGALVGACPLPLHEQRPEVDAADAARAIVGRDVLAAALAQTEELAREELGASVGTIRTQPALAGDERLNARVTGCGPPTRGEG